MEVVGRIDVSTWPNVLREATSVCRVLFEKLMVARPLPTRSVPGTLIAPIFLFICGMFVMLHVLPVMRDVYTIAGKASSRLTV